ncbi:hypothetical protein ACFVZR_37600 [Streptomyces sp. NPDC058316]|uniref:hypothetical protein n=1 Tax=unclassified Streptomyces TaxID=2593676 RepID=UPI00332C6F58
MADRPGEPVSGLLDGELPVHQPPEVRPPSAPPRPAAACLPREQPGLLGVWHFEGLISYDDTHTR